MKTILQIFNRKERKERKELRFAPLLLSAFLALSAVNSLSAADVKISALSSQTSMSGGDYIPIVHSGTTYKITFTNFAASVFGGLTITSSTGTLTIANAKTLTVSNTLTFTGTDGSTLAIGTGGTLGTAAYTASTAYEVPLTISTGLTRSTNTITVNTSQNIATLSNLTSNGYVKTSGGTGALSIDATIANAGLTNSAITIAGTSTSLGGSISQDTITGLSSTGLVKRTGANTLAIATSSTDYAPATSGSALLYGNGSGGFSSATVGSGLTFTTGTLAASFDPVIPGPIGAGTADTGAFTTVTANVTVVPRVQVTVGGNPGTNNSIWSDGTHLYWIDNTGTGHQLDN